MVKITLIQSLERQFKGKDGTEIEGFSCAGFTEDGKLLEFWSEVDHSEDVVITTKFEKNNFVELDIRPKVFGGKVKYSEYAK